MDATYLTHVIESACEGGGHLPTFALLPTPSPGPPPPRRYLSRVCQLAPALPTPTHHTCYRAKTEAAAGTPSTLLPLATTPRLPRGLEGSRRARERVDYTWPTPSLAHLDEHGGGASALPHPHPYLLPPIPIFPHAERAYARSAGRSSH
ncbi:uncharacterized protein SCHCODRAFT_02509001 [Schizophyllum commune H4-8]|uniref:uncharacterized protein n=1 Tax=Schizophyllum commune (strain H4-8 / FGSC 9210) TaxID=578458 RepID=UPI00215F3836|nr:uncharacterized protein SCHCODRAFT_02509001 [Schizophyllum commune H4-8]KAI5889964.1 hypothetical protein SCHCODRAFT_02509001 [Schizophyllum commune H4-8]